MLNNEFKNSRDYSIWAFYNNRTPVFYEYVDDVFRSFSSLEKLGDLHHINVYARRSKRFIKQYRPGNFIDRKPQ